MSIFEDFMKKSGLEDSEPFKNAFAHLGETVIPALKRGEYSSIILDANSGIPPGQVFRAWSARAHTEEGQPRIPVLALQVSRGKSGRDKSVGKLTEALRSFSDRVGPTPLLVTDFIATGETVRNIVNALQQNQDREHITVAPVASVSSVNDFLGKKLGNEVTVLSSLPNFYVHQLFRIKGLSEFNLPPEEREAARPRALRWSLVNRAMRDMGREIWREHSELPQAARQVQPERNRSHQSHLR